MASYESSSSLSMSPTAYSEVSVATSNATVAPSVPHGFVRFKNNIMGIEQLTLSQLKARLTSTEETLNHAHFSPHIMQKMATSAESLRMRIAELEAVDLSDNFHTTHISSPSSSPPAFDPTARVIMRTKAMAVARPINVRGGTQAITFAESKPLETMGWEIQKEQERKLEQEREKRKLKMEEEGVTEETMKFRKMEAEGVIGGGPAVRTQTHSDKMWAFMNYKGPRDDVMEVEEEEEQLFEFEDDDNDDDEWRDHTTTGQMESIREAAILPGSEDYYPPDPTGYQFGIDSGKWLST